MKTKKLLFSFLLCFLISIPISAGVYYVKPGGDDAKDGSSWETAFASIEKAMDIVVDDDVIRIMQGTYQRTINTTPTVKKIRLEGGYTGVGEEREINPENTVWQLLYRPSGTLNSSNRGVRPFSPITVSGFYVSGIAITDLYAWNYGLISMGANSAATFEDCIFRNFENKNADPGAGGIRMDQNNGNLTLTRCIFDNCKSTSSGAVLVFQSGRTGNRVTVENCVFKNNNSSNFILGTSYSNTTQTLTIRNSFFIDNTGPTPILVNGSNGSVEVSNCLFANNSKASSIKSNANIKNNIFYKTTAITEGTLANNITVSDNESSSYFVDEANWYPVYNTNIYNAGIDVDFDNDFLGGPRKQGDLIDIGPYELISVGSIIAGDGIREGSVSATLNGNNVTDLSSGFYALYEDELKITFVKTEEVVACNVPEASVSIDGDNCEAIIKIKAPLANIEISSSTTYEVYINAGDEITVTNLDLDNDGKYSAPSFFTILFTVDVAYETPQVTASTLGTTIGDITSLEDGKYSVLVSNVEDGTRISISAKLITIDRVDIFPSEEITLIKGQSKQFTTKIEPENYPNKSIQWTSSNTNAATVDDNGLVRAIAEGTAVITATAAGNNSKYASCKVNIRAGYDKVSFNFGTAAVKNNNGGITPEIEGFIRVSEDDLFENNGAYGWSSNNPSGLTSRYRALPAGDEEKRSFIMGFFDTTPEAEFEVLLEKNKKYKVTVLQGEASYGHVDMIIETNGKEVVSKFSTDVEDFITNAFEVNITEDTPLKIKFLTTAAHDQRGGSSRNTWIVNSLKIEPIAIDGLATWTGEGINNAWTNIDNWDTFPVSTMSVKIPADGMSVLGGDVSVVNFTMEEDGEVDLNGNILNVTGDISIAQTVASGQWYSIGFPFDAIVHNRDAFADAATTKWISSDLVPYTPGNANADYWLMNYQKTGEKTYAYGYVNTIAKNTGYIAKYPDFFNTYPNLTFEGTAVTIDGSATLPVGTDYQLVANPGLSSIELTGGGAGTDGNEYYWVYNGTDFTLLESGTIDLLPFTAAITKKKTGNEVLKSSIGIDSDGYTNIKTIEANEEITSVKYYNLQGVEVNDPTEIGIFIVKETLKSGKEITRKIANTKKN